MFKGHLRDNKEKGLDVSVCKQPIEKHDLEKLYQNYFILGLSCENTQVLQYKVFFDLLYYMGRHGTEGLCDLKTSSFELCKTPDGNEYIHLNFNEKTKKNQGDNMSTSSDIFHNNKTIIQSKPDDPLCLTNSFEHYMNWLNDSVDLFFQRPSKDKKKYDKIAVGKHTLGDMMKTIGLAAGLSKVYTNHQIKKTTATSLHQSGQSLQ